MIGTWVFSDTKKKHYKCKSDWVHTVILHALLSFIKIKNNILKNLISSNIYIYFFTENSKLNNAIISPSDLKSFKKSIHKIHNYIIKILLPC